MCETSMKQNFDTPSESPVPSLVLSEPNVLSNSSGESVTPIMVSIDLTNGRIMELMKSYNFLAKQSPLPTLDLKRKVFGFEGFNRQIDAYRTAWFRKASTVQFSRISSFPSMFLIVSCSVSALRSCLPCVCSNCKLLTNEANLSYVFLCPCI